MAFLAHDIRLGRVIPRGDTPAERLCPAVLDALLAALGPTCVVFGLDLLLVIWIWAVRLDPAPLPFVWLQIYLPTHLVQF